MTASRCSRGGSRCFVLPEPSCTHRARSAFSPRPTPRLGICRRDRIASPRLRSSTHERSSEVELHRLRGDMMNARGDYAAAEQNYQRALAVAERQSAKTFGLRAAISLARLWRDQGKCTEARDLLALGYGWFTEGFDMPLLRDAKALLKELA